MERERARLFDREAERYDRSRPSYPGDLIDEVLGPAPHELSVLDVACGTGIASRLMMERGAHVLGVELNARMAEVAQRGGVSAEVGAFETWDPAGRTFDRVTSAQGWHWLDPAVSPRKAATVLRPAGRLCVFWSVGHHPDDLADALHTAYERVLPLASPALVIGYAANKATDPKPDFSVVVDGLTACQEFAEPQMKWFPWSRSYTRDQWLDQLRTHSDHIALPPEVRQTYSTRSVRPLTASAGRST
ncbi:MAG TPA: class I SAM-dependent methyltransferase [Streptosporangiaceae bacterium]|nr:class I SAM-dependent methyltransferase [Streptosporangiaceae bacterium]